VQNIRLDMHDLHLERLSQDKPVRDEQIRNAVGLWIDTLRIQPTIKRRAQVAREREEAGTNI